NGSLTNLAYQTAVSPFPISGLSNGDYYYVVVAYNRAGQTMSNCIKITVQHLPPGDFDLSSDAGDPDKNGIFYLSWTDSDGADNYSVYTHNQFITEINGSLTNLAYQTAVSPFPISGLSNGDYYYVVVAYNQTGQTMSNCIQVTVFLSGEDGTTVIVIPGYNVIFLLSIFSFVSLIIIKKRHKSFK
ncbi:MAG: hypothetical protein ACFFBV_12535, partial [Promethearchaeota archaeon]